MQRCSRALMDVYVWCKVAAFANVVSSSVDQMLHAIVAVITEQLSIKLTIRTLLELHLHQPIIFVCCACF